MNGVIQGGWVYVAVAYSLVWVTLIGYSISVWRQHRALQPKEENSTQ